MQCSPVWDLETGNKKEKPAKPTSQVGGGLGIRTLGALQHTTFRVGVAIQTLKENAGFSQTMREFENP